MRALAALLCSLALLSPALAADYPPGAETGPAVPGYGPVFPVVDGAFALANDRSYKVTKDISTTSESPEQINRQLDSVARFLNMQARAGTPAAHLRVAVVIHGGAGRDMLTDAAYRERFGTDNPNTGLLKALSEAGVDIYLCGQTAAARGYPVETLNPAVTMALSAMGAHVRLQSEGYTLIPF